MTTPHSLVMPQLGQAMEFGVVAEWLAANGARVRAGQAIASVESDKATYEIEATADGVLRHMAAVGDEVPVGEPLAEIADSEGAAPTVPERSPQGAYAIPPQAATSRASASAIARAATAPDPGGRPLASPKARETARNLGFDLARVTAHRADGLITAGDVEAAAMAAHPLASPKARGLADSLGVELAAVTPHRPDRLIVASDVEAFAAARKAAPKAPVESAPLSRLRRIGADRLARSWRQAPHFVQMIEVDATRLSKAVGLMRRAGVAGTLNDVLIKVAADCLANHPALNARFEDDKLIAFPEISVGLAVATDEGLTVPVVRAADGLSLAEVAASTRGLIAAARAGKLSGRQLGGASLTISNLGAYGISFGTPVLNLDEPVLIFVGAIEERPVGRNGQIVLCPMTTLSVCYDHRVVDGLQAALFSRALKQRLESLEGLLPDDAATSASPALTERQLEARSAADGLAVSVQGVRHAWTVDEPAAVGGQDSGPDPVTAVLGGLLSCMIIAFKLATRRRKVEIGEVRGRIEATPPEGKVKAVILHLEVSSAAPEADVQKLLASAKSTCLVHDMLRPDLPITVDLVVRPAG